MCACVADQSGLSRLGKKVRWSCFDINKTLRNIIYASLITLELKYNVRKLYHEPTRISSSFQTAHGTTGLWKKQKADVVEMARCLFL